MRKTKLTPISAKNKLKSFYNFKECDFYHDGEEIRLNCKDNVGERSIDVFQELELQRKENYEEKGNFWNNEALKQLDKMFI